MQSEDQRSEGNPSEDDSDLECEEVASQSDGGLAEKDAGRQARALGRKRMYSEAMMDQTSPASPDAKCKQASNLHNERERERRKDLKQAVHRLRNQLQLRKTKKATTISVLKASEQEIKDLVKKEADQKKELGDLQNHHKYLTWKLESLMDEQQRSVTSNPTPVLSPLLPTPPPLTSMPAIFYMSPTGSAPHSPSSLHQATVPPVSPSPFQFGGLTLFNRFQPSPLLSPAPSFPMAAHPQPISTPPSRPIFVPPTFTFPPFLPRLPSAGRFTIPTAAGTYSHSHLLSPSFPALMVPSMPLPNPLAVTTPLPPFPTLSAGVSSTSSTFTTSTPVSTAPQPSPSSSPPEEGGNLPLSCHSVQSQEASESSPIPASIEAQSSSRAEQSCWSSEHSSDSECEDDSIDEGSEQFIDVESTDQEGGSSQQECSFLDVPDCQVRQQDNPRRPRTSRTKGISHGQENQTNSTDAEVVDSKNWHNSPAHMKQVGGTRNSEQSAAKAIHKDMFTSDIQQHSLYFDSTDMRYTRRDSFHSWKGVSSTKQRAKDLEQIKPSSLIDLNAIHHPPPVFCS